jgi:septal ring factor EnvC (AmiA/AmiB activator)
MKYTLAQAATQVKRSKSSLWRDVKSGKITGKKESDGAFYIEASELFRVYPASPHESLQNNPMKRSETDYEARFMELQALLHLERERVSEREKQLADKDRHLEDLRQQVEDTQKDRDHWRQQATYLLEDKRQQEQPTQRKGLFATMLGR